MTGIGRMGAMQCLIGAADYFNFVFSGYNPTFIYFILLFGPCVVFQPFVIAYGAKLSYNLRIISSLMAIAVLMAIIPPVAMYTSAEIGFIVVGVFVFLSGVATAVASASCYGLGAILTKRYNAATVVGSSAGGVIMNIVRMICLASFPETKSGIQTSTEIYFAVCGVLILASAWCQWMTMKHPFVQRKLITGD